MLGIGDEPIAVEVARAWGLYTYSYEPDMADYGTLKRAVGTLEAEHGRIYRIESNGEHWLEAEARLRNDFGVPGLDVQTLARQRSARRARRGGTAGSSGVRRA